MQDVQAIRGQATGTGDPNKDGHLHGRAAVFLVIAVMLAALMDALAGSVLTFGRLDMLGDTAATQDEFAGVDFGYYALKLVAFVLTPWLLSALSPQVCLRFATGLMAIACGLAVLTTDISTLVGLRLFQGFAGGLILACGQTVLLCVLPRTNQPLVQALFATAAVVAPATLVGSIQGWMVDAASWMWIFMAVVPIGLSALLFFVIAGNLPQTKFDKTRFDGFGVGFFVVAAFCLTYVLNRGNRWDWFEESHITWLTIIGLIAGVAFLARQISGLKRNVPTALDFSVFRVNDFLFAFCTSFVAGAALFGSTYLIPAFSVSVQGLSLEAAGFMLFPSGLVFVATLFFWAFVFTAFKAPPVASIPLGLGFSMASMFMLSFSGAQTGAPDMMAALLVRGFGLGGMFLAITLIAFTNVKEAKMPSAVALFQIGRQTGGLMGVAWLETTIDHEKALNQTALGAHITDGSPLLAERLNLLTAQLVERGLDATEATKAALGQIAKELSRQASVIAFDSAFFTVGLLFVAAIPVLVGIEIALHKLRPNAH